MAFTHLHVHTEYSLLDGFAPVKPLIQKAKNLGMEHLAITDHGTMYGVVEFYKEAKKNKINPIIGCEIYVSLGSYLDKSPENKSYHHLVLLAENNTGYQNLMKIVSLGAVDGFYYRPRVDKEVLRQHASGIIALSACLKGEVQENLLHFGEEEAIQAALSYKEIFGPENFFLEVQNHGTREDQLILSGLPKVAEKTGLKLVATNDVHYIEKEDYQIHDILMNIQLGKTVDDPKTMAYSPGEFYLRSEEEMRALFPGLEEAIDQTTAIAQRCQVHLDFDHLHLPYFEIPAGYTNEEYLREQAEKGLIERYGQPNQEAQDRLAFELETIESMGYVDYFLIVWDFIQFAKNNKIPVGPGRGSAAGSLVSYVLGITDIDPLAYDLIFERFLNPERVSMPDIDIDFCYERREEVIDYVVKKYGKDRVAQIVTFGTMAARNAIRDVGRVLNLDYQTVDSVAKKVPNILDITIEEALEKSPEFIEAYRQSPDTKRLIDIAKRLEGMPRHTSTHAAGVVISKEPIVNYVPLTRNKEAITTQFNMTELEELGLLKMDFLGLRTLTVIQDTIDFIEKTRNEKICLEDIPVNDEKVLASFARAETLGVFQFESPGMRAFLKELKPSCFDDLIAANSLFRPGPMNEIPNYIYYKNHPDQVEYLHPSLEPILKVTYGVIVYQEQVMEIVRSLAGFSLGQADNLRRAMGKKDMSVMEREREHFIEGVRDEKGQLIAEGALKRGVDRATAEEIYDLMMEFAKYAFNKSHSAAYSLVAVRTAWLKTYYPVEFMAALISSVMGNTSQVALYIEECRRLGIEILTPDVNFSEDKFTVEEGAIRFGLKAIKNVGSPFISAIVKARENGGPFQSMRDFFERVLHEDSRAINKRAVESLIKAGAFQSFGKTRASMILSFEAILDAVQEDARNNIKGQESLFDGLAMEDQDFYQSLSLYPERKELSEDSLQQREYEPKELLRLEKEVLGIYLSDHPLRPYENLIEKYSDFTTIDLKADTMEVEERFDGKKVQYIGIIDSVKKKFTKNNQLMAFVMAEDLYGALELIVFPNQYKKYAPLLEEDKVLLIEGKMSVSEAEEPKLMVQRIQSVEKLSEKKERVFLRIKKQAPKDVLLKIKNILKKYPGRTEVNVYFEEYKKNFTMAEGYFVNEKSLVIEELVQYLGRENVKVV